MSGQSHVRRWCIRRTHMGPRCALPPRSAFRVAVPPLRRVGEVLPARDVVLEEHLADEFAAAADTGLVEDGLEVVLDGVADRFSRSAISLVERPSMHSRVTAHCAARVRRRARRAARPRSERPAGRRRRCARRGRRAGCRTAAARCRCASAPGPGRRAERIVPHAGLRAPGDGLHDLRLAGVGGGGDSMSWEIQCSAAGVIDSARPSSSKRTTPGPSSPAPRRPRPR